MSEELRHRIGLIRKAPENFLTPEEIAGIKAGRRDFIRKAFATATALAASGPVINAYGETVDPGKGEPNILNLPEWSTTLGMPVATRSYGLPSKYEASLIRRQGPG